LPDRFEGPEEARSVLRDDPQARTRKADLGPPAHGRPAVQVLGLKFSLLGNLKIFGVIGGCVLHGSVKKC
jgi:hypothetical protein